MEGQTHTRTCSLADSYTLVRSCIYLYTQYACIQIFADAHTLLASAHRGSSVSLPLTPAVDTSGASRQCRPCSLIAPSRPLTIRTEKKSPATFISALPGRQCRFRSLLSLLQFLCNTLDLLSMCLCPSTHWDPCATLLFSNHRSVEAKVNCQGLTFTVTFNRADQLP